MSWMHINLVAHESRNQMTLKVGLKIAIIELTTRIRSNRRHSKLLETQRIARIPQLQTCYCERPWKSSYTCQARWSPLVCTLFDRPDWPLSLRIHLHRMTSPMIVCSTEIGKFGFFALFSTNKCEWRLFRKRKQETPTNHAIRSVCIRFDIILCLHQWNFIELVQCIKRSFRFDSSVGQQYNTFDALQILQLMCD